MGIQPVDSGDRDWVGDMIHFPFRVTVEVFACAEHAFLVAANFTMTGNIACRNFWAQTVRFLAWVRIEFS